MLSGVEQRHDAEFDYTRSSDMIFFGSASTTLTLLVLRILKLSTYTGTLKGSSSPVRSFT